GGRRSRGEGGSPRRRRLAPPGAGPVAHRGGACPGPAGRGHLASASSHRPRGGSRAYCRPASPGPPGRAGQHLEHPQAAQGDRGLRQARAPPPAAMAPRHEIELDPAEAEIELETAEAEQGLDEPLVEAEIEADSLPLPEDEPLLEVEPLAAAPAARGEDAFASDLAEAD